MRDPREPLGDDELAAVEAQYKPVPSFADWPAKVPRGELWDRWAAELTTLRTGDVSRDVLNDAVRVAMRAAAFDTGAIENLYSTDRGLTRTVAVQAATWQQELEAHSADALSFFEAQLKTYELVLDAAVGGLPVTEAWIRRIHEELTSPQETYTVHTPAGPQEQALPRGEYKRYPNHVEVADGVFHAYAPVAETGPEMARLVAELQTSNFVEAHPMRQASYAHYALAAIHPFADGNGRVARAVASVYTYRAASVPLLIFADQRERYFDLLAKADDGEASGFVGFVADAGRAALQMVVDGLRAALAPKPDDAINRYRSLMTAKGELTHQELDQVAGILADDLAVRLQNELNRHTFPPGLAVRVLPGAGPTNQPPSGYRPIINPQGRYVVLELSSAAPAQVSERAIYTVYVSTSKDAAETFVVKGSETGTGMELTLDLDDVYPAISAAAEHRLHLFAERVIGSAINLVVELASEALSRSGYQT